MKKILIIGILATFFLATLGLVTANYGFSAGDVKDASDKVFDGFRNRVCNNSCDGDVNRECNNSCKQLGEGNGICEGQCSGEKTINQCNKEKCLNSSNSCGGCRRN